MKRRKLLCAVLALVLLTAPACALTVPEALELLEEKLGRTAVEAIIREELGRVTFQEWPRDTERFLRFRRRVCRELGEA